MELTAQVLKLNQNFEPLEVISWQVAISDIFSGVLVYVEEYPDIKITSPSITMPCPAVVRLKKYAPRRKDRVAYSNRGIFSRDEYTCQYCGKAGTSAELTVDHVLPKSRGGKKSWNNITTACTRCNRKKADKTPEEAGMVLLSQPYKPKLNPVSKIKRHGTSHPEIWKPYLC